MARFKVGDRIVFAREPKGGPGVNSEMRAFFRRGGEHTIDHIGSWISLEGSPWLWDDDWLEHAEEYDSL